MEGLMNESSWMVGGWAESVGCLVVCLVFACLVVGCSALLQTQFYRCAVVSVIDGNEVRSTLFQISMMVTCNCYQLKLVENCCVFCWLVQNPGFS